MKLYAKHNDIETYFSEFKEDKGKKFCKARLNIRKKYDTCPFCGEFIKKGNVLILINNWKLFPNTIVHEDCCNDFSTREKAIQYLYKNYQEALRYKHWFNINE